jgi:hypothetical protein
MARNTSSGAEQRAHPRRPTSRKVYLVAGRTATKCALIDVAEGGARIRLLAGGLPQGDLFLVDTRARRIHLTRSVWQSEREAGLQFVATATLDEPGGGAESATASALVFADRLNQAARAAV